MSIRRLDFAEPFFSVKYLLNETEYEVGSNSIIINLSQVDISIQRQKLGFLQSAVIIGTPIRNVEKCLIVEDYSRNDDTEKLFRQIREKWVLAYETTKEERHRGVGLWRTEKIQLGNVAVNMCYADSVPLNVGLHREHWGGECFREVHTQIVGYGRMQQFLEQDVSSLYLEELLAPGATHRPMCDEHGDYPWHQYETITPGVFMPIEMQFSDGIGG